MPQSLAVLLIHYVFSTKHRQPLIPDHLRSDLHSYIGGTIANLDGCLLGAGSVEDHIHLLVSQPRTVSVAAFVEKMKTSSSKWIKPKDPNLRAFAWQNSYGAFTISPSHKPALLRYINNQREHHKTETFQEEYRRLLAKYEVEYDERYVWD